jgi:hypothetical protein
MDGLKQILKERNMTFYELHNQMLSKGYRVSYKTLLKFNKPGTPNVNLLTIIRVAKVLDVDPQELY